MRIFIAGEGSDEIGNWAGDPAYLPTSPQGGVVEVLLRQVRRDGWLVVRGRPWRSIRQYKVGRDVHGQELRRVLGVVPEAVEWGCDLVAFVRDQDGALERREHIEDGILMAQREFAIGVIGGVSVLELDSWILALLGESRSEETRQPKAVLAMKFGIETGVAKADAAGKANIDRLPEDVHSLRHWLERARDQLLRASS